MNKRIRFCSRCNETGENIAYFKNNDENFKEYNKGYLAIMDKPSDEICPFCNKGKLIVSNITNEEFNIIGEASNYNRQLLDAMVSLKEKDIIEYELKLGQFRTQVEQRESSQQQAISNQPKCPTCSSTNIRKIGSGERMASVLGFGLLSKKINKTWKCNSCGHTW